MTPIKRVLVIASLAALAACQSIAPSSRSTAESAPAVANTTNQLLLVNRVTWGANTSTMRDIAAIGADRWLEQQLTPSKRPALPPAVQAQIDALTISQKPATDIAID